MLEWFDSLLAEGEAGIDRLIAERTQETVQLDFKEKADASHGSFSDDDKRTLAKALSAFANSAGGLLIFGVEARREKDDPVDCARTAKPITGIEQFRSQATGLVGQLLQPKHDGIRVGAIPSAAAAGTGYLLVAIERSERRPHRSEASGHKQYFKRAGDNSFAMEHYDIEDAFRRDTVPELRLVSEMIFNQSIGAGSDMTRVSVMVKLALHNVGNVSAERPYVSMSYSKNEFPRNVIEAHNIDLISFLGEIIMEIGGVAIHPNTTRTIGLFTRTFNAGRMASTGSYGLYKSD